MEEEEKQVGITRFAKRFLFSLAILAVIFVAVLFSRPVFAEAAHAEGFVFDSYDTLITRTYNGASSHIKVGIIGETDVDYVWYREGDEDNTIATGDTLTVTRPAHSGIYRCRATKGALTAVTDPITVRIGKITVNVIANSRFLYYGDSADLDYTLGALFDATALSATEKTFVKDCDEALLSALDGALYIKEDETDDNFGPLGYRKAGKYTVGWHSVDNDLYALDAKEGRYTVQERTVYVTLETVSSEYGEEINPIEYIIENPAAIVEGETKEDLKISVYRDTKGGVGIDAGKYDVIGLAENTNYNVVFRPAEYIIRAKKLTGYLVGASELIYTGKTPEIVCLIGGDGASLGLTAEVSFNKPVRDAGDYIAYAKIDNTNYELTDNGEFKFTIAPAPLSIKIKDVAYLGAAPEPEFEYLGFVNGETPEVLTSKPTVSRMPTSTGCYTSVFPDNGSASAVNYEITYLPGTVNVYATEITYGDVSLNGIFLATGTFSVEETDAKAASGYSGPVKAAVYAVTVNTGDRMVSDYYGEAEDGTVSAVKDGYLCTIKRQSSFFPLFLRSCIIDKDGEKHSISDFSATSDTITFRADVDGTFVIYYDFTVVYIIVGVVLAIIIFIVIKTVNDKKKYRKALAYRQIATAFADEARDHVNNLNR